MKRMTISENCGLRSPVYLSLSFSVIDCVGSHESMIHGPLERYSDGSSGSDVMSKPEFQKSAAALSVSLTGAGAAASPRGLVRIVSMSSAWSTPAFSATTWTGWSMRPMMFQSTKGVSYSSVSDSLSSATSVMVEVLTPSVLPAYAKYLVPLVGSPVSGSSVASSKTPDVAAQPKIRSSVVMGSPSDHSRPSFSVYLTWSGSSLTISILPNDSSGTTS